MPCIPFVQYVLPHGRHKDINIERPEDVFGKAEYIRQQGFRFEAEVLSTGQVSFTIADDEDDHDIEVVPNGPEAVEAIDRMINRFYEKLKKEQS